jgi:hypothetical protein
VTDMRTWANDAVDRDSIRSEQQGKNRADTHCAAIAFVYLAFLMRAGVGWSVRIARTKRDAVLQVGYS